MHITRMWNTRTRRGPFRGRVMICLGLKWAKEPNVSASAVTMKFAAAAERDETKSRTDAEGAHDHALREHEAVAPASRSRCMCSPSPTSHQLRLLAREQEGPRLPSVLPRPPSRCRDKSGRPRSRVATSLSQGATLVGVELSAGGAAIRRIVSTRAETVLI